MEKTQAAGNGGNAQANREGGEAAGQDFAEAKQAIAELREITKQAAALNTYQARVMTPATTLKSVAQGLPKQ